MAFADPVRIIQATVTLYFAYPGGALPPAEVICDVSLDRSIQDVGDALSLIQGTAAAQASITLDRMTSRTDGTIIKAVDLSPFAASVRSAGTLPQYGVQSRVVIAEGGTQVFDGQITKFEIRGTGVTMTALDPGGVMRGQLSLPSAGGGNISPMAVVDLALRAGKYFITPPPKTKCVLSVPGSAFPLPEVGEFVTASASAATYTGNTGISSTGVFEARSSGQVRPAALDVAVTSHIRFEGWVSIPVSVGATTLLWRIELGTDAATGGPVTCDVSVTTAKKITVGIYISGTSTPDGPVTFLPTWTADTKLRHIAIYWFPQQLAGDRIVDGYIDGETLGSGSAITWPSLNSTGGARSVYLNQPTVGFQMWQSTDPKSTPLTGSFTGQPPLPVTSARLDYVARATELDVWQTIQEVAAAEGAVAYFDAANVFRYQTRDVWRAKRYTTAARTVTADHVTDVGVRWDDTSLRSSVSATVTNATTVQSTAAAPAFVATEEYTCPPRTGAVYQIDMEQPVYDLKPMKYGVQTDALSSWFYAVASNQVGDPAALQIGCTASVRATATGVELRLYNPNSVAVSLWEPTSGGPYLRVHGKTIVPSTSTITAPAASVGDAVVLPDNPYRQSRTLTTNMITDAAAEVSLPQMVFDDITLQSDPTLQLGDVLAVQVASFMDVVQPCQILGHSMDLPANGMHQSTFTVRAAYPPTGWVLDVTGRSELGTTTVLAV